jgi:hypothetical protein
MKNALKYRKEGPLRSALDPPLRAAACPTVVAMNSRERRNVVGYIAQTAVLKCKYQVKKR